MKKIITFLMAASFSWLGMLANDKPEFPGGKPALDKFIQENIHYPEIAKENGVEGIVVIGFLVNIDGSLKDIKPVKFVDPDLEKEAVRVVSIMPAWIPAEKEGTPIEAPSQVDIPFLLD